MKERLTNHFNKQTERDTHEEGTIIKVHLYVRFHAALSLPLNAI